jgi:hypothetical protein
VPVSERLVTGVTIEDTVDPTPLAPTRFKRSPSIAPAVCGTTHRPAGTETCAATSITTQPIYRGLCNVVNCLGFTGHTFGGTTRSQVAFDYALSAKVVQRLHAKLPRLYVHVVYVLRICVGREEQVD